MSTLVEKMKYQFEQSNERTLKILNEDSILTSYKPFEIISAVKFINDEGTYKARYTPAGKKIYSVEIMRNPNSIE